MATSIGLLAQELSNGNPWWRGGTQWVARDPDLSEVAQAPLSYESGCLDDLEPGNLYILRGPRRVGKTVAVKQTIRRLLDDGVRPTRIIRVAVDGWDAKALRTLVANSTLPVLREGETRFWFLDEVSAVSGDWAQQLKWLRDNDEQFRRDTVVLTGSNARALTVAGGVLAGRRGRGAHLDRILLPMGFRTFASTILRGDVPPGAHLAAAALRTHEAKGRYEDSIPWLDGLARACPQRQDTRWLPKPKSQSKLYAVDPLVARLPHLRNTARPDLDPTVLTEMQIGMAMRRRVLVDRPTTGNDDFLFYTRTPARKEIDFVSADLGGVAIEGKYTDRGSWRSEAATVNASVWDGILVTRNVLDMADADTAWAVPAGILAYFLDV